MSKNSNKIYSFSAEEIEELRELDTYIFMRNQEITMAKNMSASVLDAAIRRVGEDSDALMKAGKKVHIDFKAGKFEIQDKGSTPENPIVVEGKQSEQPATK